MAIFLKVSIEESEQKLLNFIERHTQASKNEIHKWIRKGDVRVNKKRADPFDRISIGDEIRLPPFAQVRNSIENPPKKNDYTLDTIYEDSDLLIINKEAGISVQGGTGQDFSIVQALQNIYAHSPFTPSPAHRLDKDTSGILIIAKSYTTLRALHDAFSNKSKEELQKFYYAKSSHALKISQDWEKWEDYIVHTKDANGFEKSIVTDMHKAQAQYAYSLARCHNAEEKIAEIEIITGRKHQIRVQMSHRNMPVLGDIKYNGNKADRLYLHAHKIIWKGEEFTAPVNWL